jgi:chromosome segregation ATPase
MMDGLPAIPIKPLENSCFWKHGHLILPAITPTQQWISNLLQENHQLSQQFEDLGEVWSEKAQTILDREEQYCQLEKQYAVLQEQVDEQQQRLQDTEHYLGVQEQIIQGLTKALMEKGQAMLDGCITVATEPESRDSGNTLLSQGETIRVRTQARQRRRPGKRRPPMGSN